MEHTEDHRENGPLAALMGWLEADANVSRYPARNERRVRTRVRRRPIAALERVIALDAVDMR